MVRLHDEISRLEGQDGRHELYILRLQNEIMRLQCQVNRDEELLQEEEDEMRQIDAFFHKPYTGGARHPLAH